jgi:hypothetical protein
MLRLHIYYILSMFFLCENKNTKHVIAVVSLYFSFN